MSDGPRSAMPPGYRFIRVLGSGGAGWVALADHETLRRQVAVKTVFGGGVDLDMRRRLEREGQALARLVHPRIVRVYEIVEVAGDAVLVMEFVDGADLATRLKARSLSAAQLVQVLTDVAEALDFAAENGVVHRDVKPANVLVGADGRAKVADFGIARLSRATSAFRTAQGTALGTPLYASPEQMMDPDHESAASDAYSFAVMAYEAYVGVPPFRGESAAMLMAQHAAAAPAPPQRTRPEFDDHVAGLLVAGLAKDPAARMSPSRLMRELAATSAVPALAGSGSAAPVSPPVAISVARPAPLVPALRKTARRRFPAPLAGLLVALAVLALVLLLRR